ncbi:MAG: hypothetical protein JNL83_27925 [Myxococcales bacterium]|nr:hypothetical protein [Myxococcales bacterium]
MRSYLQNVAAWLGRWPVALATVCVLGAVVLLPGLGASGLWEPHERQLADRVAPPKELEPPPQPEPPPGQEPPEEECLRAPPKDATARLLTNRAIAWGRDTFGDSDTGRRLPFALMGLLTVLATAGIAMRLGRARSGVIAGLIVLSMPLLVMQSRMLTTEIGTACGGALIVYGFVALGRLGAAYGGAGRTSAVVLAVDAAVSVAALALGSYLAFRGGGALLGLIVPIGACAAAAGFGVAPLVRREGVISAIPGIVATIAAGVLVGWLAYQLYSLETPRPGMLPAPRAIFGKAIVTETCWSSLLGGMWRPDDDLRMAFDSMFEQIAYGTFPWGVLAPIAMVALLASADRTKRSAGAVTVAWGAGAWIACEVFQRKVGFTIYAGFPAMAVALGVWLDDLLARRAKGDASAMPAGMMLVGLYFLLAVLDLAKDLQSFPDHVTSLLIGNDQLPYPKESKLLLLPTKLWILQLGMLVGLGFGLAMLVWRPAHAGAQRFAQQCAAAALAATVVMAGFWAYVWQPRIALSVSSKALFETYKDLRAAGDQLVIMGDLGHAPRAYAPDTKPEMVATREQVVKALARPERVFAVAPQSELCTLHRELSGKRYYVVEDRNVRNLLLSNKVDGTTDKNPLATAILHEEPKQIGARPKGRIVWDNKIQLIGWDVPATMSRGSKQTVKLYFKILQPVGGTWKGLMHFDGPLRFNGDHEPIKGRCPTATWQPGDFIVDTVTVTAGGGAFPAGKYDLWIGFFTGSAPNWKNMSVSEAPGDMRDTADRVKITSVILD